MENLKSLTHSGSELLFVRVSVQILVITGVFALLLALYDTFEYACCYDDEKRKTIREWLIRRIESETDGNSTTVTVVDNAARTSDTVTETTRLLHEERLLSAEEIALDTFSASTDGLLTAEHVTQLTDSDDDVIIELP